MLGHVAQADGDGTLVADIAAQLDHHALQPGGLDRRDRQWLAHRAVVDGNDVGIATLRTRKLKEKPGRSFQVFVHRHHDNLAHRGFLKPAGDGGSS